MINKFIIKKINFFLIIILVPIFLSSCKGPDGKFKLPGGDARKFPADPEERVKKNLEEGRGFRIWNTRTNPKAVCLILQVQMNYGEPHLIQSVLCH